VLVGRERWWKENTSINATKTRTPLLFAEEEKEFLMQFGKGEREKKNCLVYVYIARERENSDLCVQMAWINECMCAKSSILS
jgi:hypothetical protein